MAAAVDKPNWGDQDYDDDKNDDIPSSTFVSSVMRTASKP